MKKENKSCDMAAVLLALKQELKEGEKSEATIEKYMRDAERFLIFYFTERIAEAANKEITIEGSSSDSELAGCHHSQRDIYNISRKDVIAYKEHLRENGYSPSGINSMLAGVRALLKSMGKEDIKVKNYKVQEQAFADESRMLTKGEYLKLVRCFGDNKKANCSKGKHNSENGMRHNIKENDTENLNKDKLKKAALIMETICSTGIRVSELKFFTVEAVRRGEVNVYLKGKERKVLMSRKLSKRLLAYAKNQGITEGSIFLNGKGKPLHRSQIWQMMKSLCRLAGVEERKVFPHNLRKLFARAFYNVKKDIAKLADVLGHSSINTTRRYIKTIPKEHVRQIERLGLVV